MYYFIVGIDNSIPLPRLVGYREDIPNQGTLVATIENITTNDVVADLVLTKDRENPTDRPNFEISLSNPRENPIIELVSGSLMSELNYWFSNKVIKITVLEMVTDNFFSYKEIDDSIMQFINNQPQDISEGLKRIAKSPEYIEYISQLTAMWRAVALVSRFKKENQTSLATSLINANLNDYTNKYFGINIADEKELKELKIAVKIYATYIDWSLGDRYDNKKTFLLNTDYVKLSSINNIKARNANVRLSYLANNESLDSSKSTEDEVYTKLPDYAQIAEAYRNIGTIEASMRDKLIDSVSDKDDDDDLSSSNISIENGFIFPQRDMILPQYMHGAGYYALNDYKTYKNAALARKIDPKFIEGNADMNDLEILPNEERFFKALCELFDYAYSQASQTSTFDEDKLDAVITYYEYYIDYLVAISRSYTGYVSISTPYLASLVDVEMELGVATGIGEEAGIARVSVGTLKQSYLAMDTLENLKEFLNNAYTAGNKYAYCEAIIKLMRWGRKKPSKLKISGYPKYFNFAKCMAENTSGSFAALKLQEEDGKSYKLIGKIDYNIDFADRNYIASKDYVGIFDTSIGYLFVQKFLDSDGSDKYLYTAFSNLDIIEVLQKEENPFYEISLDKDGNVIVDCNRQLNNYSLDDIMLSVSESESETRLYKTESIKTFALKHPVESVDSFATLRVLKNMSLEPSIMDYKMDHRFTDEQSLLKNITTKGVSKQECYIARVADNITDFMLEANDDVIARGLQADDIQGILNVYNLKYLSSYTPLNQESTETSTSNNSDTMDLFGSNNTSNSLLNKLASMEQTEKAGTVKEKKSPSDYLVQSINIDLADHITLILVQSTNMGVQGVADGIGVVGIIYKLDDLRVIKVCVLEDIIKASKSGKLKGKIALTKILPDIKETYGRIEQGDTSIIHYKFQTKDDLDYFMKL